MWPSEIRQVQAMPSCQKFFKNTTRSLSQAYSPRHRRCQELNSWHSAMKACAYHYYATVPPSFKKGGTLYVILDIVKVQDKMFWYQHVDMLHFLRRRNVILKISFVSFPVMYPLKVWAFSMAWPKIVPNIFKSFCWQYFLTCLVVFC